MPVDVNFVSCVRCVALVSSNSMMYMYRPDCEAPKKQA